MTDPNPAPPAEELRDHADGDWWEPLWEAYEFWPEGEVALDALKGRVESHMRWLGKRGDEALDHLSVLTVENERMRESLINTPETADFMAGVPLEAIHQRDRWGVDHDAGKTPFDWFWLIGYLAQKAASSAVAGDTEKAMHHTISTAAALANWHAALAGKNDLMRPGIGPDNGGDKPGSANALAEALSSLPAMKGEG